MLQVRFVRLQRSQGSLDPLFVLDALGRIHRILSFRHASQAAVGDGIWACCLVIGRSELVAMAQVCNFHGSYSRQIR